MHHLYFTGTPTAVIALGASFSALEVVPLAFIGFEAYQTFKLGQATPWMQRYRWPILFFTAVAFWNVVGAGLFGFLINPPLPLYYMQGLNLTPLHGHTALFGVYGFLGIGLMLFCLRGLRPHVAWNERVLKTSFWAFNIGLAGMALLTLLPIGIIQLNGALEQGYWYARSADLMQKPIIQLLVWMRVPGDTIFSVGALSLAWFVLRLWVAPRRVTEKVDGVDSAAAVNTQVMTFPENAARLLAAAPHRLLFLVGATNVLAAMGWWAAWLVAARWHWDRHAPAAAAGRMDARHHHAVPRAAVLHLRLPAHGVPALAQPARADAAPLPAGGRRIVRRTAPHARGTCRQPAAAARRRPVHDLRLGDRHVLAGATDGASQSERPWHALSVLFGLGFGLVGLVFYLLLTIRLDAQVAFVAIKFGGIPMLLPIYFTVCHRMIPFFTNIVVRDYQVIRPMWILGATWAGLLVHMWLELQHAYQWLWIPDAPLALLFTSLLVAWWPSGRMPALLRVLFLGFAWLPAAFALYAWQSYWFAVSGEFVLGRAPAHALFIGFFGSLLVAMVTRVTQGHSGRPLVLGGVAATAFVIVQLVAVTRIVAELVPDSLGWQAVAALGWLLAFLPWVLRSGWIYLTPRVDGQPAQVLAMIEFYPQIKWVHVAAVIASGALFALRGTGVLAGAGWPMFAPLRYLSYTIDTVLLTAALMLATILHQYPFVHAWLTVKVLLLVVYIVLGTLALKRARTPRGPRVVLCSGAARVPLHRQRGARPPAARHLRAPAH